MRHGRMFTSILLIGILFVTSVPHCFSQGEYVLPYPSLMPGHPLYTTQEIVEKVQGVLSFGNFAKLKHHLRVADKKLVEAKTLFEYQQYLFARNALDDYKKHLRLAHVHLEKAKKEGKNTSEKKVLFRNAIAKHWSVLKEIKKEQPEHFLWQPERGVSEIIRIREILDHAIQLGEEFEE